MKKFETPVLEIELLQVEDVIAASEGGNITPPGENETPDW